MACRWSQHHQEWLVCVPVIEEGEGAVVDEVSVVILAVVVSMLLLLAVDGQGVVVIFGVTNLQICPILYSHLVVLSID